METTNLNDQIKKTYDVSRESIKNEADSSLSDINSKVAAKKNEIYKEV